MSKKRKLESKRANVTDDARPAKKIRSYTSQDAELAKLFEDLASNDESVRQIARSAVVTLATAASDHGKDGEDNRDSSSADVSQQKKILSRLMKGLCSGRNSARLGFSEALTEILSVLAAKNLTGVGLSEFVDRMVVDIRKSCKLPENPSRSEKRNHHFGHLSGLGSLLMSGALFRDGPAASKQVASVLDQINDIAQQSPSYLEQYGRLLTNTLRVMKDRSCDPDHVTAFFTHALSHVKPKSPEGLALWLEARSLHPDMKLPKNVWHHRDPLGKKELSVVAKILRQETVLVDQTANGAEPDKSGTRQAEPHFVWDVVLREMDVGYIMRRDDDDPSHWDDDWQKLWTEAVEKSYFADSASTNRKSLGFQMLSRVIVLCPAHMIEAAMSPNVKKCLINQSAQADRNLHAEAKAVLKELSFRAQHDRTFALPIFQILVGDYTSSFDKLTNTHTLQQTLTSIDASALSGIINSYRTALGKEWTLSATRNISDQLLGIIRSRKVEQNDFTTDLQSTWSFSVLQLLADAAYLPQTQYETSRTTSQSLDNAGYTNLQDILRSRLASCIASLLDNNAQIAQRCVPALMSHLQRKYGNEIRAISDVDADVRISIDESYDILKQDLSDESASGSVKLLVGMTILQLYNGESEAVLVLDDLRGVYESLKETPPDHHGALECENHARKPGQPSPSDVIFEVILGMAARSTALSRRLSEQVFPVFASDLTFQGLSSAVKILGQSESLAGQNDLFDKQVNHESEIEDDDASADDSDIEEDGITKEAKEVDDEGFSNASDDAASADLEADEEDDADLIALDNALSSALKTTKPTLDGDAGPEDTDSSMDDEQMMALEPQLTEIFKQRATATKTNERKQAQKAAKENMINFKNRVLDLLHIYVKSQHSNPLALRLISPLLQLIGRTSSKQIADKASNVLRTFFDTAKKHGLPELVERQKEPDLETPSSAWAMTEMAVIHDDVLEHKSKAHTAACSRACIFLARCQKEPDLSRFNLLYSQTFETALNAAPLGKRVVPMSFFSDWSEWVRKDKK